MRILPSGGCSSTTLKPFSAVGITLDFSLRGIMYAWRNWFGSFLKSGDVAAVVTAKAFTVSNPSASSAHCCLCAVMDLWFWGGVLKSSYLGNAHGTCCCSIPVESLVGPLLLLCLRMGIALWLLQLFGGFIFFLPNIILKTILLAFSACPAFAGPRVSCCLESCHPSYWSLPLFFLHQNIW